MLHPSGRSALALVAMTLLCAGDAGAQWSGFFHVSGGVQPTEGVVTSTATRSVYGETATYDATMTSAGGGVFDASAGVFLWGNVGVGLGATVLNARGDTALAASVPSPLFTNRPRSGRFDQAGLKNQQLGVHLQALYMLPLPASERIRVAVSAGPSWFRLRHDALDPNKAFPRAPEVAPYTSVSVTGFPTVVVEGTGFGYNVGVDVTYLLIRWAGVGFSVRYMGGSVENEMLGAESIGVGGVQAGAGFRFVF